MIIRQETPADESAIYLINEQAFSRTDEADLVDLLRANGKITLSLVTGRDTAVSLNPRLP
jgi:predicted N-acetyltransferase YhbS